MELSERFIQTLEKEGFPHVYEWQDAAGTVYPEHSHEDKVTIFVTDGEVTFTFGAENKVISAGQRFDVPPGKPHSVVAGPAGAIYIVGEMIDGDS